MTATGKMCSRSWSDTWITSEVAGAWPGDTVAAGARVAGHGGDRRADGRHLVERGVRAGVACCQARVEQHGPSVRADELAFRAVSGPRDARDRDAVRRDGGQR